MKEFFTGVFISVALMAFILYPTLAIFDLTGAWLDAFVEKVVGDGSCTGCQ